MSEAQPKWVHPFNQGYDACLAGLDEYDNPFTDDYSRSAWEHGRETAQRDLEKDAAP